MCIGSNGSYLLLTDRELTLYMCRCQLPPAAADLAAGDFTEMKLGTWGSPAHGQTWGQQHGCPDPTRVGPPESEPAGCGGEYRYFPGEAFGTDAAWDWSAPFTADYVLRRADDSRGVPGVVPWDPLAPCRPLGPSPDGKVP